MESCYREQALHTTAHYTKQRDDIFWREFYKVESRGKTKNGNNSNDKSY